MNKIDEESRIIEEYTQRDARLRSEDWRRNIYHPRHSLGHLLQEHNHNILVDALNQMDVELSGMKILDVGCGDGSWLRYLVEIGANPANCVGVDLSEARIGIAKQRNPAITWHRQNIDQLPFPDGSFDLVLQSVVFSSILDPEMRSTCASEMRRVTKKRGKILWVDLMRTDSDSLVTFSVAETRNYFPELPVIYEEPVHPAYFRRLHRKFSWLARLIYFLTKFGCESMLIVFENNSPSKSELS